MKLGKGIMISEEVELQEAPKEIELNSRHYEYVIKIDGYYAAILLISEDALLALQSNKAISLLRA